MNFLDWLFRRRRTETAADSQPEPVVEKLRATLRNLERLPTLSEGATRAMAVARNPDVTADDLGHLIEKDPALAAGLLKLANSPFYRTGGANQSIRQAIVKIGLREAYNMVLTVAMRSLFRNLPRARHLRYTELWEHSFLTACVCRKLNSRLRLGFQGDEFTCGLMHDIGRVLIAVGAPDHFEAADPMDFVEGPELLAHERAVLGTDHCDLGAWYANVNQLPDAVVECVQSHHAPADTANHPVLVALVACADHLANFYQRERVCESYDAASNPAWPLLAARAGLDRGACDEIAPSILAAAVEEASGGSSAAA